MGTCACVPDRRQNRQLPIVFQNQHNPNKKLHTHKQQFQFQLFNVSISPIHQKNVSLFFSIPDILTTVYPKNLLETKEIRQQVQSKQHKKYQGKWNQRYKDQFSLSQAQLNSKTLTLSIQFGKNIKTQILKISLYLIVNGPFHHSIQIMIDKKFYRVNFDLKISHIIQANLKCLQLNIHTYSKINVQTLHFTYKAISEDEVIIDSLPSFDIKVNNNNFELIEKEIFVDEQCPNPMKNRSGLIEDISTCKNSLSWRQQKDKLLPTITFDVSIQQINLHSIQVIIWTKNKQSRQLQYIGQMKIPLWKILQHEYKQIQHSIDAEIQKQNKNFVKIQERKVKLQDKLYHHHNYIGICQIQLLMMNQKLIQQSKYCTRTEMGIVNLNPTSFSLNIKSNSKTIHQIWNDAISIENQFKNTNNQYNDFKGVQNKIFKILLKIKQNLDNSQGQIIYNDAKKYQSLINNQNIFLALLEKLFPFVQDVEKPTFSQITWNIVINIIRRKQFQLQNLSLKGIYKTEEAILILKKKVDVAIKYHQMLTKLLICALKSYGIIHNTTSSTQFLALTFFKLPTLQNYFFQVIQYNNKNVEMQKTIQQMQNSIEPKTSFNSPIYLINTDWNNNFHKILQKQVVYIDNQKKLIQSFSSKRWFMQIGFKQQFFYSFLSSLLKSLKTGQYMKSQQWKYLNGYVKIVSLILTQLNTTLIKTTISLFYNQHLINIVMPIICQKTNSFCFQSVNIFLDIIQEAFQVLTIKRTVQLPSTFNQNYFFNVVKLILQGQHFYSINRVMMILFNNFDLLGSQGRYQISMYLMGKIFFKLYYHWSKDIRAIFYNMLLIKIKFIKHQKVKQIISQYNKVMNVIKIIDNITQGSQKQINVHVQKSYYRKLQNKIFNKLKNKSACKNDLSLVNILSRLQEENSNTNLSNIQCCTPPPAMQLFNNFSNTYPQNQTSFLSPQPSRKRRSSESYTQFYTLNNQRKISAQIQIPQTIQPLPSLQNLKSDPTSQTKGRKKRRPSFFLNNSELKSGSLSQKIVNQLHQLSQITSNQMKNIKKAKIQFEQIHQSIIRYSELNHGKIPITGFFAISKMEFQG